MELYFYEGPVTSFGKVIRQHWEGRTQAVSPAKAKSNLAFNFKMKNQMAPNCKIELPGELIKGEY